MKTNRKLFYKRLIGLLEYIIWCIFLLTIAFLLNRFYQMLIFVLFYSFIQNCFKYRFHAESIQDDPIKAVRLCKAMTICLELTYLAFCKNLDISIYSNLLVIFIIAFINCLIEFSLEHILIKEEYLKDADKLNTLCRNANLTELATNRMILKYVKGMSYQEIADLECVDVESVKKSINRSRKKILKG